MRAVRAAKKKRDDGLERFAAGERLGTTTEPILREMRIRALVEGKAKPEDLIGLIVHIEGLISALRDHDEDARNYSVEDLSDVLGTIFQKHEDEVDDLESEIKKLEQANDNLEERNKGAAVDHNEDMDATQEVVANLRKQLEEANAAKAKLTEDLNRDHCSNLQTIHELKERLLDFAERTPSQMTPGEVVARLEVRIEDLEKESEQRRIDLEKANLTIERMTAAAVRVDEYVVNLQKTLTHARAQNPIKKRRV